MPRKTKAPKGWSPAEGETILTEGNGNKSILFRVISNDGGSRGGKPEMTFSIVVQDPENPDRESTRFDFGAQGKLRVIISDRPGGEPPGRAEPDEKVGPAFRIVAAGGGNRNQTSPGPKGKERVVIKGRIISHNGSA